jgi:ligand-binding sensor domain-containing protein
MTRRSFVSGRTLVAAAGIAVAAVGITVWHADRAFDAAEREVRAAHQIRFVGRPVAPLGDTGFEAISSPAIFLQAAKFDGHLFLAGPAGLFEYDPSGALHHAYLVGRDLPGSPLIALTTAVLADSRESELVIGTASEGILAFNGRTFRQILAADADARAITSILATPSGHLLIGTKKKGVLLYDGMTIAPLHSTLENCYVTALAGAEADLWIGTLNQGVLHFHAGATDDFGEEQGLPDRQVTALAISEDKTYAGTPLGVAEFSRGRFSRVLAPGVFATALLPLAQQLYVGSEDQGVSRIAFEGRRPNPIGDEDSSLGEVHQLFPSDGSVFAIARNGLFRITPHAFGWQPVLKPNSARLADGNISALASDRTGHLWIGYFDHGLDLLAPDGSRATHVEDQHVFCVNRIFPNAKTGGVDVATANGLVRFDAFGKEQQILTRADGLIADHVTDIAAYGDGLALATPAGLTFLDSSGARSLYAFHGLVNNHVYALGVLGDQLFAGTLGGISLLDKGSIVVNYTTSNSHLKHNWITAVVRVREEWMVGTYGAGILSLDSSGHFHSFDIGSGNFEVNPNAMLATPNFVLAGTLGNGLYLYDRSSERWSVIQQGLPSLNVTALHDSGDFIYVGTDNGLVRIAESKLHS